MSFFFSSIKTDVFPNKAPISQNLRISSYSKPPDNIDAIGRKYRRSLSNPPSKTHKEKRSRITYHALLEAGLQIRQDPDLLSADKRSPASWKPRKREEINNQKGSRSQSSTLLLLDAAADRWRKRTESRRRGRRRRGRRQGGGPRRRAAGSGRSPSRFSSLDDGRIGSDETHRYAIAELASEGVGPVLEGNHLEGFMYDIKRTCLLLQTLSWHEHNSPYVWSSMYAYVI